MKKLVPVAAAAALLAPALAAPQSITPARDEVVALTSEWKGDRFPDGRPTPSSSA
jgi:hypothetical protein